GRTCAILGHTSKDTRFCNERRRPSARRRRGTRASRTPPCSYKAGTSNRKGTEDPPSEQVLKQTHCLTAKARQDHGGQEVKHKNTQTKVWVFLCLASDLRQMRPLARAERCEVLSKCTEPRAVVKRT